MKKKILIVGSGGRENALGWKMKQSPFVGKIYFAPGNGGTNQLGENIDIDSISIKKLRQFAIAQKIDLTVVGPDDALAKGIVDEFRKYKLKIFGPTKKASKIEWSKVFSKKFMKSEGIPTAKYQTFRDLKKALDYSRSQPLPMVIKANGLALGKGVIIANTHTQAEQALKHIMSDKVFGDAGNEVVIEEYLQGQEVSVHVITDGKTHITFPIAQDHKPIGEGNTGPNTGGMGTIAPCHIVDETMMKTIERIIIKPTLQGFKKRGIPYVGCLFPGLMITKSGPMVLEYNARFGDPETQSYMRLLQSDLFTILDICINGNLSNISVRWKKKYACCIVVASAGYPKTVHKGDLIHGLERRFDKDVLVFHAGTRKINNAYYTNSGRVLGCSSLGKTLPDALRNAYKVIKKIRFKGMQYRKDIGIVN